MSLRGVSLDTGQTSERGLVRSAWFDICARTLTPHGSRGVETGSWRGWSRQKQKVGIDPNELSSIGKNDIALVSI